MATVRLSRGAKADLLSIGAYTLQTWGSAQAERYLDDLELCERFGAFGCREDHTLGVGHAQIAPASVDGRCLRRGHEPAYDRAVAFDHSALWSRLVACNLSRSLFGPIPVGKLSVESLWTCSAKDSGAKRDRRDVEAGDAS